MHNPEFISNQLWKADFYLFEKKERRKQNKILPDEILKKKLCTHSWSSFIMPWPFHDPWHLIQPRFLDLRPRSVQKIWRVKFYCPGKEFDTQWAYLMWRTDSLGKTLMLGKIEARRRRGQQDEMVGWHHRLNGHEFEQAQGVGDGQGSLVCCNPWGRKESDTTEGLNWTEHPIPILLDDIFYFDTRLGNSKY